ncbi:MAG: WXG100 family type VII secretion target [Chloroflexota bacterium]
MSPQADANPEDLERFAAELGVFCKELEGRLARLRGQFAKLGETWQDQEHSKYAREFQETSLVVQRFLRTAEQHTPLLKRKAQRLRGYLENGAPGESPGIAPGLVAALGLASSAVIAANVLGLGSTPPAPVQDLNAGLAAVEQIHQQPAIGWWQQHGYNQLHPDVTAVLDRYGRRPGGAHYNGCGTVALAMLINHANAGWAAPVPELSPQALVEEAGRAGYFNDDNLISFAELESLAREHGFRFSPVLNENGNAVLSSQALLENVKSGKPALVLMRYAYTSTGEYQPNPSVEFDHFIILAGVSTDGQEVMVVNPHPGINQTGHVDVQPETISMEVFRSSWEFDQDQGLGQGIILEVFASE